MTEENWIIIVNETNEISGINEIKIYFAANRVSLETIPPVHSDYCGLKSV